MKKKIIFDNDNIVDSYIVDSEEVIVPSSEILPDSDEYLITYEEPVQIPIIEINLEDLSDEHLIGPSPVQIITTFPLDYPLTVPTKPCTTDICIPVPPNPGDKYATKAYVELKISEIVQDKHWTHRQPSASAIWIIDHDLNKFATPIVVDTTNREIIGEVTFVNENKIIITFTYPFAGKAYLN